MLTGACTDNTGFCTDEVTRLRLALASAEAELEKFRQPPLVVCEVMHADEDKAVVKLANSNTFWVGISSELRGKIGAKDHVLAEQRSLTIVKKLEHGNRAFAPETLVLASRPNVRWADIGGLWKEIEEIKEVVELPLKKPELFRKIGIQPPTGVLLHGPPGCGKTLLAKALANSSKVNFIEIVGSELVHKYIGDGAKYVKEIFQLAKEKAPSIIFIDEIDAIAARRMDMGASAEREVQRTFMQLLAEIDGFKGLDGVKIIGATNRFGMLDDAVIRPGRLDRLVQVGLPNAESREEILRIYMKGMSLKKISMRQIIAATETFTGAELKLVCTEAGYFAIRENRTVVTQKDFMKAIEKVQCCEAEEKEDNTMYG